MAKVIFSTDTGMIFNEDFVYGTDTFGFLIDGATGLFPEKITPGNTDAQFFAHELGKKLIENSSPSLKDKLFQSVHELSFYFPQEKKDFFPSATLAAYEIKNDTLEIFYLGDSPILVYTTKGVEIFSDKQLAKNEQKAIFELNKNLALGDSLTQATEKLKPLLKKNRQTKNTSAGYWIMDPTSHWKEHLNSKTFPLEQVKGLILASDGFYRLMDLFQKIPVKSALEELNTYGKIIQALDELRALENAPHSESQFPRLKKSDDASVLVVLFNFGGTNEKNE